MMGENVLHVDADPAVQPPQKSHKKKWLTGCGIGCLVMLVLFALVVALGVYGVRYGMKKVNEMTSEFEQRGFVKVTGQNIEVAGEVAEPTLYFGQMVKIIGNCRDEIAIIAQVAQIHGEVAGTLYFRGQTITIEPGAHLQGDLDLKCQAATIYGKVDGQVQGAYAELQDKRQE
jgi:cytoskeletal protein CcmA (bactofilin family)